MRGAKKEVKKGKNENGIYNSADSDISDVSISSVQHAHGDGSECVHGGHKNS